MVVIIVLADQQLSIQLKLFESTGAVQNVPVPVRPRSVRSIENIAAAEASESPNVSLRRRSQALGISVT